MTQERRHLAGRLARRFRPIEARHHSAILGATAVLALLLALGAWRGAEVDAEDGARRRFEADAQAAGAALAGRIHAYEQVLRGARGLFDASQAVDRGEWRAYVQSLELGASYPALMGIAYSPRVPAAVRDRHVREVRDGGLPEYAIFPDGTRPEYFPVVFVEPFDETNRRVPGFDLASEPTRLGALESGRDSGSATISGNVTLAADRATGVGRGILMVLPVYRANARVDSVAERRDALTGFVSAAFRVEDVVRVALGREPTATLRLYDVPKTGDAVPLFDNTSADSSPRFRTAIEQPMLNRVWRIEAASTPAFESTIDRERPRFTLIAGLLVGATAVVVVWLLLTLRAAALALANRMTDELRETEERFRLMVDGVRDYAIFMVDPQGRVATWNAGAERISGYRAEEIVGRHISAFYLPEDVATGKPQQDLERALRDGRSEDEGWRLRSDGQRIWATVALSAVRNARGELIGLADVTRDLTERIRARERLRESEERLALAMKSSGLAFFDWNLETGDIFLSAEWGVLRGDEPRATRTTIDALQRMVHPDDLPQLEAQIRALLKGEIELYQAEHRVRTQAGDWMWINSTARVTDRDTAGRARRVTGTNADITERKRVEQIKDEFVATVSHELRTPLTAVLGALALLREGSAGGLPDSAQPLVEMAYQNSERLNSLVNDILDIARLESGRMEFLAEDVDVVPFLERALALNAPYAERYGVRFVLAAPPGLRVAADSDRLMQVVTNLLSNAAKFSPRGAEVVVTAARQDGMVQLSVRDHGRGIPREFRSRIFEKFAQADSSDSRQKGGTGLGLAIAKALVERMDGRIWYESEVGRGTAFFVDLPSAGNTGARRDDTSPDRVRASSG